MDDNKNNRNNPFGEKDYFGLGDLDGFNIDLDETVRFTGDSLFEETEISFEKPKQAAPKSFSLGPINVSEKQPEKKKFVVTFDDSEDIVPPVEPENKNPRSRGGVYFSNGVPANNIEKPAEQKRKSVPQKQVKPKNKAAVKPVKKEKPSKKKRPVSQSGYALRFISAVLACTLFLSFLGISCLNDVLAI